MFKSSLLPCFLLVSLVACTPASTDAESSSEDALLGDETSIVNNNDGTWTVTCKDGRVERRTTEAQVRSFSYCPKLVKAMRWVNNSLFDFAIVNEGNTAVESRLRAEGYVIMYAPKGGID